MLQGAVCAQITPLCEDGSIDLAGVRALTRRLVDGGIPCLYPNGTNGESLSLSQAEREAVAQAVVDEAGGRATVYIQCGAATVRETEALVRHAISAGADGAGVMTPVFFALDDEAIYRYYASILEGVGDFPIYAYNIPPRAGNDLSPSVLGALMGRYDALKGVKYSYPTTAKVLDYLSCALPRRASVLVGSDAMALPCILYGGDGWVSGPSAAFTGLHARLWREICAQSFAEAAKNAKRHYRVRQPDAEHSRNPRHQISAHAAGRDPLLRLPSAAAAPAPSRKGNAGRAALRLPGVNAALNRLSLSKKSF